jgi:uncharacterized paraquat-inducible protein A
VILTMFAAEAFDSRPMWDVAEGRQAMRADPGFAAGD